ncbi:MAG TPA: CHASE2 domain-containing protein, partial [Candidatus Ozemobacteraceae bacterium]|nr:CHASE2 domain-containing protein [Candidatus Ozemobacteraceae bacterium]
MTSEASFRGQGQYRYSWECFISLLFGGVFAVCFYFGLFTNLENYSLDARFRLRGELPAHSQVVLVSITDACLAELGPWPWPRAKHAELLKILQREGAGSVGFDLIFSETSALGATDDEIFAAAMRESGNVILAQTVGLRQTADPESLEPVTRFVVDRAVPLLASASAGEGFIDMEAETMNTDGLIRNLLLQKTVDGRNHYLFGLALASHLLKQSIQPEEHGVRLGERFLPYYFRRVNPGNQTVYSSFLLNYAGPNAHFRDVSYLDVLQGRFNKGIFASAAVIVGTRARGLSEDVKFSPFGAMAGMEIHANLLQNILDGRILHRLSPRQAGLLIIGLGLALGWVIW